MKYISVILVAALIFQAGYVPCAGQEAVMLKVDDPSKLAVLGIIDLLENVAAFFAQNFNQGVEILHPVIDHEG